MTLAEMAERLGYKSGDGLRWQIHRGVLKAELIGKTYVVSDQEYERYVKENAGQRGKRKPKDRPS